MDNQLHVEGELSLDTPAGRLLICGDKGQLVARFASWRCLWHVGRRLRFLKKRAQLSQRRILSGRIEVGGRHLADFTLAERLCLQPRLLSYLRGN
ncbi:MAG: hypothetical protein ACFBZ8_06315 [Opitutales bacterium]